MGRRITDGKSIDVTAPDATAIAKGELYRIGGITGFAFVDVGATDVDRGVALDQEFSVWRVKVPVGTCGTRGMVVYWEDDTIANFKKSETDIVDAPFSEGSLPIAQVIAVRSASGYADLKLVASGVGRLSGVGA